MKNFTAISALLAVATMAKADCWSSAMGYNCCTGCDVQFEDDSGKWGIENNNWCGIDDNVCNKSSATECWSAPEYQCCKGNVVVYSDEAGDWGIEQGQWCGIIKQTEEKETTCWSLPSYPCCKGNTVVLKDNRGSWGYEDNHWCGIDTKTENKGDKEVEKPVENNNDKKKDKEEEPKFTEQQVKAAPKFSMESGFYEEKQGMTLSLNNTEGTIYYTLDSSDPTTSSTAIKYNGEIKMYDRSTDPNVYSKYEQVNNSPYSITLQNPIRANPELNEKATVVRAVTKLADGSFSPIITKTFLIKNKNDLSFYSKIKVLSMVTDPSNLFDKDKGIYVCGQQYLDWKNGPNYNPAKSEWDGDNIANFFSRGKEWEREANLSLFVNGKEVKNQDVGIRIKGQSTRNHHIKSFNVFPRKKYSSQSKFEYDIIEGNKSFVDGKEITAYDSFSIRGCYWFDRIRESIVQSALKDHPILATFDSNKALLFIDGEFWGLYDICEKSSPYFFEYNYNLPHKDVAIIKNDQLEDGSDADLKDFKDLVSYCRSNDLTKEQNYNYVAEKMDLESLIYHYAVGLYLGIFDWPNRNYLVYRNNGAPIEGNVYSDGKWRFGSFDFDYSAGLTYADFGGVKGYEHDSFKKFQSKKDEFPTPLFSNLIKNPKFYKRFTEVMHEMGEKIYEPQKMKAIVEEHKNKYIDYLVKTDWRWYSGKPNMDFNSYKNGQRSYDASGYDDLAEFFVERPKYVYKFMEQQYGKPQQ